MRHFIALGLMPLLVAALANAAPQRVFVSTAGNDANAASNCSLTAPCRSFDTAVGVAADSGEVIALDSGGYGRFAVTKSVTVTAPPGVYAGISVFSGTNGVDINSPFVHVVLRGLTINGQDGTHGINFQSGLSLVVENCTIGSMSGTGIRIVAAGASNTYPSQTYVVGTTVTRNSVGIYVGDGPASATVARSSITNNDIGIEARGTLTGVENALTVADTVSANNQNGVLAIADVSGATVGVYVNGSTLTSNASNGIYSTSVAGGTPLVTATSNLIARNFDGVAVDSTAKIVIGHNTISRNRQNGVTVGVLGIVLSRGDNVVNDNVLNDVVGTPGSIGGI